MKNTIYILILLIFINCNKMSNIEKALLIEDETESLLKIQEIIWEKAEQSEDFENLTEAEQTFVYVEALEAEVNNGGFDQYFFNTNGKYSEETLEALKKIGAVKTYKIVQEAFRIFPENPIPKDIEKRRDLLENIDSKTSQRWTELEDQFYLYEENIGGLLLKYVKGHKTAFE